MSVDKEYCMSSYLAFRYIEDPEKDFFAGIKHMKYQPIPESERVLVRSAFDIDQALESQFKKLRSKKLGLLLSGGMDSAILASYMSGCDAYTFRFLEGSYQKEELARAEYYAKQYGLHLHYVNINWNIVETHIDTLMKSKGAPVHSIEPQIMQGALQAKADGIEEIIIGDASDYVFYGMDQLCSQDWKFDDFVKRYMYIDPQQVLQNAKNMQYLFERYRTKEGINYLRFLDRISTDESYLSYANAFCAAKISYHDPYEVLKMAEPLDLSRLRKGESKYWIRELFSIKYPQIPVPQKFPMPRPVDFYFLNWAGPSRAEFRKNQDMSQFTGNQKWQLWCLERFLNLYDPT